MNKNLNFGITLIALIITIIILLILAGVTLSMVMGENGIFGKANKAKEQTQIANAKEIIRTAVLENEVYKKTGDANKKGDEDLKQEIKDRLEKEGYTINDGNTIKIGEKEIKIEDVIKNASTEESEEKVTIADGDNTQGTEPKTINGKPATYSNPIISVGFKAVDNSTDNTIDSNANWTNGEGYKYGLVIEDKEGNQFVWIAVDGKNVVLDRYSFDDSLNYGSYNNYSETLDSTWAQKVESYGGYYIGRYETKYENSKCVVKRGNKPTVDITRDTAREYAKKMKNDYGYGVTTDLLNSYMWDTALKYIDYYTQSSFSTTTGLGNAGNKNSGAVASGSYSEDIKCNIADMSGNVIEWITEYYSSSRPCVSRGGCYHYNDAACRRGCDPTSHTSSTIGFRCALYW